MHLCSLCTPCYMSGKKKQHILVQQVSFLLSPSEVFKAINDRAGKLWLNKTWYFPLSLSVGGFIQTTSSASSCFRQTWRKPLRRHQSALETAAVPTGGPPFVESCPPTPQPGRRFSFLLFAFLSIERIVGTHFK